MGSASREVVAAKKQAVTSPAFNLAIGIDSDMK